MIFDFCIPLLLALPIALAGCSNDMPDSADKKTEKPVVAIAETIAWKAPSNTRLPGIVRPGKRAVLSTRVAGTLLAVETTPGDLVTEGDLLATVDAAGINAAVAAAREEVEATKAALQQARRDSQRLRRLYEEDLIARIRSEKAGLKLKQVEARLKAAEAKLKAQETSLSYTRLTAPFDGQVTETPADEGSFVGPGQPLVILEDRDRLRIDVPVSSRQAAALTPGQSFQVVTAVSQEATEAKLVSVIPALKGVSTGQRLRLSLDSPTPDMAPGQVVTVLVPDSVAPARNKDRAWVGLPEDALIRRGQLTGTLVVDRSGPSPTIHMQWIKTTTTTDQISGFVPVVQGLSAGREVVLNPSTELEDGQEVAVRKTNEPRGN